MINRLAAQVMQNLILLIALASCTEAVLIGNQSIVQCFVNSAALEIFDAQMSPQLKNDILESTLYAQMMANHAYDRFSDFSQWHVANIRTYQEVGWTLYTSDFKIHIDNHSTSHQETIKNVLSSDLSEGDRENIIIAMDNLYNNYTITKLFTRESSKGNFENFQILVFKLNNNGDIMMSYNGFIINVIDIKLRQLFLSFGLGILKEIDYRIHRKDVSSYLGGYATSLVREIKLNGTSNN